VTASALAGNRVPQGVPVVYELIRADLRMRFGRGPWRVAKWLLDPFILVGVYLILTAVVLDRPGYALGLSLVCAVIPFQLIIATVANAQDAIRTRHEIILNVRFARILIPLASAGTEAVAFIGSLSLVVLMIVIYGVTPTLAIAFLPLVLVETVLLAVACSYLAAIFGLWLADLRYILTSVLRMMFFLAPGLIPLSQVPSGARAALAVNPFTGLFESYRDVLLYGRAPVAWHLGVPLAWSVVALWLSVQVYRREEPHFAKVVG
jgi:ABC-type polysaccharide/polyol phosphate export permease